MIAQVEDAGSADSTYKNLYKLGGIAAMIVAVLTLSEMILFAFYPQPSTAVDWFTLFQRNKIVALLDFWGLEVPMYIMFIFVFVALYAALRKTNDGFMSIALIFVLLGTGIFLATNNPFSMLSLSSEYAAAATDAQRSTFLAAGQAVLTNTGQRAVGGFNMGLFLVSIGGLMISARMLQSDIISRPTAYAGILAYALSLGDYLRQAMTQSPAFALIIILPGALFLVIWFILVGRRLYQLGHLTGKGITAEQ